MRLPYSKELFCSALTLAFFCVATSALASNQTCDDATSPVTSNVNGNVRVPNEATCTLTDLTVTGNVMVGDGATLNLTGAQILQNVQAHDAAAVNAQCDSKQCSSIGGNFQAEGGEPGDFLFDDVTVGNNLQIERANSLLLLDSSTVSGNVQVHGTTGVPPALKAQSSICNSTIGANLQLNGNRAPFAIGTVGPTACGSPGTNFVSGNVEVNNNEVSGSSPSVTIDNNDIEQNLHCVNNSPPQSGADNDVDGNVKCPGVATSETDTDAH